MRNIEDVVVMRVSHEHEVCLRDMRIDGRIIRRRDIIPSVYRTRISQRSFIGRGKRRWRPKDSREIWIDQNNGGSIADFPPCRPHIFEDNLTGLFRACGALSRHCTGDHHRKAETENREVSHGKGPPERAVVAKSTEDPQREQPVAVRHNHANRTQIRCTSSVAVKDMDSPGTCVDYGRPPSRNRAVASLRQDSRASITWLIDAFIEKVEMAPQLGNWPLSLCASTADFVAPALATNLPGIHF